MNTKCETFNKVVTANSLEMQCRKNFLKRGNSSKDVTTNCCIGTKLDPGSKYQKEKIKSMKQILITIRQI